MLPAPSTGGMPDCPITVTVGAQLLLRIQFKGFDEIGLVF
jgi:hypothetical protein